MRERAIIWGVGAGLGEALWSLWLPAWWLTPSLVALLIVFGRPHWSLRTLTAALGAAVLVREFLSGGPWGGWLLGAAAALGAMLLWERLVAVRAGALLAGRLIAAAVALSAVQAALAAALAGDGERLAEGALIKTLVTVASGLALYLGVRLFNRRKHHARF